MRIVCPHCRNAIELVDQEAGKDILCPGCGSTFRIDAERTPTFVEPCIELGRFRLIDKLGSGAFGVVWKAIDTQLDRTVALKIPHAGRMATEQETQRFLREGRSAAQLRHPAIVSIHEVGQHNGVPYLVADFIEGVTLADLLTARRLPFREAAEMIAQLADALHYAHSTGVIHRDIKPSNIMIERGDGRAIGGSPDGVLGATRADVPPRPLLMDFGLALRHEAEVTMTVDGQILGTPAYMSPEQAAGLSHQVDGRSDIYSLGVVMYVLLTGELPFRGNSRMLIDQVLREEPRPPRRLNDHIPRDLETITLKCLAKERKNRYAAAAELAADLRRYLRGEPVLARPVGPVLRLWRWAKRNQRVAALSAAVIALLVAISIGSTIAAIRIAAARADAVRRFKQARQAVDVWQTGANEVLRYYPGMQLVRKRLLQKAAEDYARWANESATDPELIAESAKAFVRLGDVRESLGEFDEAEQAYRSAQTILERLCRAATHRTEHRFELASTRMRLGLLLDLTGRDDAAESEYRWAIDALESLIQSPTPDFEQHEPEHRHTLAATRASFGRLHAERGRLIEARAVLETAIDELDALNQRHSNSQHRSTLANCRHRLAQVLSTLGQTEAAHDEYLAAINEYESLMAEEPDRPGHVEGRAGSLLGLARELTLLCRDEDAASACRDAIADYEHLLRALGDVPQYRQSWATAGSHYGHALHKLNRNDEAEAVLKTAVTVLSPLVEQNPLVPEYREALASTRTALGQVLTDLNRAEEAEPHCSAARTDYMQLMSEQPGVPQNIEGHAICLSSHGRALERLQRFEDAAAAYQQAVAEFGKLIAASPNVPSYRDALAWTLTHFAELDTTRGKLEQAQQSRIAAIERRKELVAQFPDVVVYRRNLAAIDPSAAER